MRAQGNVARVVAIGVSATYAIALYASGLHIEDNARRSLAYLPTLAGIGVVIFDLWIWKAPGIIRLVGRPRLYGTWITDLRPHADSHIPDGGNRGPIKAAVIIEQSCWSLAVTMLTEESASHSTSAAIHQNGESRDRRILTYTYANAPKQQYRRRSHPHVGAAKLDIVGMAPSQLSGTYWTDRLTVGDMTLRFLNRRTDYATLAQVMRETSDGGDAPTSALP